MPNNSSVILYPCGCVQYNGFTVNQRDPRNPNRNVQKKDVFCKYHDNKEKENRKSMKLGQDGTISEETISVYRCQRLNEGM